MQKRKTGAEISLHDGFTTLVLITLCKSTVIRLQYTLRNINTMINHINYIIYRVFILGLINVLLDIILDILDF